MIYLLQLKPCSIENLLLSSASQHIVLTCTKTLSQASKPFSVALDIPHGQFEELLR